ncbi:hypothetical protein EV426DRAFT_708760 [Tirmania nivea]|nr:hypothetical protein EV426DRAFT_708760 [Tirmania nivea]
MKTTSALRRVLYCFPQYASTGKVSRVHATSLQPVTWPLHSLSWSVHSSARSSTPSWQSSTSVPSIISPQYQSAQVGISHPTAPTPPTISPTSLLTSSNRARFRATFQALTQARAQSTQTAPPQNIQPAQSQALPQQSWFTRIYGQRWWNSSELREDSAMLVAFLANRQFKKWKGKWGKLQTPPESEITPGYQKLKWWEKDPSMVRLYIELQVLLDSEYEDGSLGVCGVMRREGYYAVSGGDAFERTLKGMSYFKDAQAGGIICRGRSKWATAKSGEQDSSGVQVYRVAGVLWSLCPALATVIPHCSPPLAIIRAYRLPGLFIWICSTVFGDADDDIPLYRKLIGLTTYFSAKRGSEWMVGEEYEGVKNVRG